MKELFTKKIYYKKFNHRLAIQVRRNNSDKKKPTPEIIEWLLNTKFGKGTWRGTSSHSYDYNRRDWYTQPSQCLYTIFFKDESVFTYLEGIMGRDSFAEFEKPMDEQHTQMMEKEKVITRSILFHKKYRIAIRVPSRKNPKGPGTTTAHLDDMTEWLENNLGARQESTDVYLINRWSNGTFYFANPKDAMMFKLVFGEYIGATERVVLVSELEEARKEVA